ncbi:cytochrome ubiquinol oxidase subunit I [Slackia heliotrinireducens]|uniref:cytochrome ubiquinol oxidase subunit I n=1 Tax=Slackia heliotrinireducens TaxID=84110 RepID=UPI0033150853
MELFTDVVFLSRLQFALVVIFHFCFVPLSVGTGLIMAIMETRYYKSRDPKDAAIARFWVKIFTTCFAVGVASGITMEFSFGTNWADYSRFVGDIFGAPLAAEALFAFFLESTFLGVVIFGRDKISPKFYLASAWLVEFGSCLSALWILIANSWMQTPAGAELSADGSKAVMTNFLQAAFNPSTGPRFFHTLTAIMIVGSFMAIAVAAWYIRKGTFKDFATKTLKVGVVCALVSTCALLVSAHSAAVTVANEQPSKIAMMEGHYDSGTLPLYAVGVVDTENEQVIAPLQLPGFTSFLASNSFDTEYPGLNDIAAENEDIVVEDMPVQLVFQTYHLMVALFGVICVVLLLGLIAVFKKGSTLSSKKWWQWLMIICPVFPMLAIQAGWAVAEVGRQPYVVYPATSSPEGIQLLTSEATSSLTSGELTITLILFVVVYALIAVAFVRLLSFIIKKGPDMVDDVVEEEGVK